MKSWSPEQRVKERERLEIQIQELLTKSQLFDDLTVHSFKKMTADMRDCLRKWTAQEAMEGK